MTWLSENPSKRWFERYILWYSPIWMAVVTLVQFGGYLAQWGDVACLALGISFVLPLWVVPLIHREAAGHAMRFNFVIGLLSLLQCYFGSQLFFDAFGMQYHFKVSWMLNGTPVFLYLLTVAYFSTYYVVLGILMRAFSSWRAMSSPVAQVLLRAGVCYAVALCETAAMATERMKPFFSYRDPRFVMLYGSICYGTIFFVTLPTVASLDERPGSSELSMRALLWRTMALNMVCMCCYEVYRAVLV